MLLGKTFEGLLIAIYWSYKIPPLIPYSPMVMDPNFTMDDKLSGVYFITGENFGL